jgi:serine/threonine protein kinase
MTAADDQSEQPGLPLAAGAVEPPRPPVAPPLVVPSALRPSSSADIKPEFIGSDPSPLPPLPAPAAAPVEPAVETVDPHLGRSFGGYVLERKVGQGGMGLVYQGRQVRLDRVVAVKVLNRALNENQEFIKRFEREAKSIAKINHPNIVAVYDFGSQDGNWYMVCEFVEGQSLAKMITDRLMVPVDVLAPLLIQCLDALAHVGAQGVVHRDIKPDNILITAEGQAKIADFGLAKDVSNPNDHTDLTAVGMAMGTPAYMSPEQCMGRRLDGRSDIYALGVTAYYALTGEKPFTGQSSFEVMTRQREHIPPPPIQLNPSIPKEYSDLVMRMLAKDPAERGADAAECRRAWKAAWESQRTPRPALDHAMRTPAPEAPARSTSQRRPSLVMPPDESPAEPGHRAGSERSARQSTDRRPRSADGGITTCNRCGHVNRTDAITCVRCGVALRPGDDGGRFSDAEAQRLLDGGQFREAAAIFARLADRETDKRNRTVLRSKEREARKQDAQAQVTALRARADDLIRRGDLRGAITVLEGGRPAGGDSGATTMSVDGALLVEIAALRRRLAWRNRVGVILIVLVLAALAAGITWIVMQQQRAAVATTGAPGTGQTP